MSLNNKPRPFISCALLLGAMGCLASASAATGAAASAAESRWQQERSACNSGASNQDRSTCLREAGAARAEMQRSPPDPGAAAYAQNRRQRCEKLPDSDRTACLARMDGQGSTSGSAAEGGILRELVTRQTGPAEPATPGAVTPAEVPAPPAK